MSCSKCRSPALIRDDDTGQQVCTACGLLQEFDGFEAYFGGVIAPEGTFVRLGTAGSGTVLSYHTKKLLDARSLIDDVALRLGLSAAKSAKIRATASEITDGEFGHGRWFTIFVAACAYVVMRADSKPLLIAEVSNVAGCDEHELGRMVERVVRFLDLRASNYPELNIVALFERSLRDSPSLSGGDTERMRRQGVFLVDFMVKRWLTTGRRPAPVVAAALALVGETNGIESAGIEAAASELQAKLHTCKQRYRELCEALVKVAQALPWGSNVTVKNIVKNAPLVIHFMEMKKNSCDLSRSSTNLESLDLDEVVRDVLSKDVGYGEIRSNESMYFDRGKFLGSESSSALTVQPFSPEAAEEEVLPPSLVANREACEKRRERIKVAKRRIEMIAVRPSEKKKKRRFEGDIDCEDMIVEALLLHGVREDDILTGHYNALMDLHVL